MLVEKGFFYILATLLLLLARWLLYRTDIPRIKSLPEVAGWPLFGNLIDLGETHAKTFALWAKQYGPVFQVRLGIKVRSIPARHAPFET